MVDNLIRLYDYDETSFSTNGLGTLADATECKVTEELNGSYELAMKYPIDGARYSDIDLGMLIYARPNQYSDFEPFRIYSISRPLNGIVTINAQHISYDLSGYIMPRWDNSTVPFATGPRSAFTRIDTEIKKVYPDFPFTFYTDSDEDHPAPDSDMYYELTCNVPKSVRSLLGDGDGNMLSIYTGDYLFEKFNVSFLIERGENKGVTIKYGKNMTELTVNEDNSTLYSAVYPYWTDQERYVELPEKVIRVRDDIPDNTLLLDLSSDFAKCPADEDIREFVERYINDNNLGLPFSSIDVSFEQLSRSSEYSQYAMLEQVELGDYITVEYDLLLNGPQTVRCTKVVYDVLLDKAETIELGTSRTLVSSLAKQQNTLSNSTQYTDQYVQEAVKNITYDTALSTTSENAVQNKVVTKAINNTNDQITNIHGEISNIITQIEGLTPGTGSITYGYSLPTGGSDGDAYVQLTKEAKDPKAIVTESSVHNNFEVSNFNRTGDKYGFDISGTVEDGETNYALVNVENLTPGSEYKVTLKINHDIPTSSLEASYYYNKYDGGHNWTRAFGIFVGNKNQLKSEYIPDGSWFRSNMKIGTAYYFEDPTILGIKGTKTYSPHINFQGIYKNVGEQEYDFYFKATYDSASFGFVFDDAVNGTTAHMSVSDLEITYVGSPLIDPNNFSPQGDVFANATYNDNFVTPQGITDWTGNAAWTNWGGSAAGETIFGFTFKQLQTFDRIKLNIWQGGTSDDSTPDVARNVYLEASVDDKVWNAEDKEWVNLMPNNEALDLLYPYGFIKHVYLDINEGSYHDVRVRFHTPTDGLMEAMQFYKREEILPDNHVKDLFFKIDGEWLQYPRDDDEDKTFGYGTEDPTEDTQNDIYAKLIEGSEPDTYDIDSIFYKVDSDWLLGPSGGGGGGGGREYLGDITPRVSSASSNITSSSYSTSWGTFYDWYAFNGISPASYRDPQGNCWQGNGTDQWIQYQFNEPRYFTEIELKCFSNYSGDWVGNIKVEGSSDGTNFTNVLASGTTQQITVELAPTSEGGSGQESDIHISLDDTETWSYIRVTFVENMSVSYAPSCYVDEIYVYGGKDGGGGGSGSDDYSTTETRIGTWIDGKPLYRCVYDAGSYVSQISWDVSSFDIELITRSECLVADVAAANTITGVISCTTNREMYLTGDKHMNTTGGYFKRYIIIEYTKTTD